MRKINRHNFAQIALRVRTFLCLNKGRHSKFPVFVLLFWANAAPSCYVIKRRLYLRDVTRGRRLARRPAEVCRKVLGARASEKKTFPPLLWPVTLRGESGSAGKSEQVGRIWLSSATLRRVYQQGTRQAGCPHSAPAAELR